MAIATGTEHIAAFRAKVEWVCHLLQFFLGWKALWRNEIEDVDFSHAFACSFLLQFVSKFIPDVGHFLPRQFNAALCEKRISDFTARWELIEQKGLQDFFDGLFYVLRVL